MGDGVEVGLIVVMRNINIQFEVRLRYKEPGRGYWVVFRDWPWPDPSILLTCSK